MLDRTVAHHPEQYTSSICASHRVTKLIRNWAILNTPHAAAQVPVFQRLVRQDRCIGVQIACPAKGSSARAYAVGKLADCVSERESSKRTLPRMQELRSGASLVLGRTSGPWRHEQFKNELEEASTPAS